MRDYLGIALLMGAVLAAAACEHDSSTPPARPQPLPSSELSQPAPREGGRGAATMPAPPAPRESCPMEVAGTQVRAQRIDDGIALVFTTTSGDIADLRGRVRVLAEMHAQHGGMIEGGVMHAEPGAMGIIPAEVVTDDIDDGVRLEFRPRDPADLELMCARAEAQVQQLALGRCPVIEEREERGPRVDQAQARR
jgi:hypothetical protein